MPFLNSWLAFSQMLATLAVILLMWLIICSMGVTGSPAREGWLSWMEITQFKDENFLYCLILLKHFVPLCTFDSKTTFKCQSHIVIAVTDSVIQSWRRILQRNASMTFVLLVENAAELLKNYKLKMVAGKVFQICVYAVQIGSYMTTLFRFFFKVSR